jgi:mono/diheme cytochrome c family protein
MRYSAMELGCVLDQGLQSAGGAEGQRAQGLLLRALDGYTRPVRGEDLLEPGAFLAFGEPELSRGADDPPRFTKIDRGEVDPGPFYLVWIGPTQNDPHVHPWPYQLSTIQVAPFSEAFPRTVPEGLDSADPGWTGYALFQRACASCHAINGEGGKVGPDLNVPRSIVEYRPIDQIRGYIRDPEATRYTSMPAHSSLSEADLDALIAYFSAMSERKDDPKLRGGS